MRWPSSDPVVEYAREGFDMFSGMLEGMKEESFGFLFNVSVEAAPAATVARWHRWQHRPGSPSSPLLRPRGQQSGVATKDAPAAAAWRTKGIDDKARRRLLRAVRGRSAQVQRQGGHGGHGADRPKARRAEQDVSVARRRAVRPSGKEELALHKAAMRASVARIPSSAWRAMPPIFIFFDTSHVSRTACRRRSVSS